jgi:hypothetical protein
VLIISGTGYLYGSCRRGRLQADAGLHLRPHAAILAVLDRPLLKIIVLIGRERISSWTTPIRALAARFDWRTPRTRHLLLGATARRRRCSRP